MCCGYAVWLLIAWRLASSSSSIKCGLVPCVLLSDPAVAGGVGLGAMGPPVVVRGLTLWLRLFRAAARCSVVQ
jgi:hypothetical protein